MCVGLRYKPPTGIYAHAKPIKGRDVFVIPCEIVDKDTVVVADVPRHSFGLGEAAMDEAIA